jgi:hypothetical protein
LAEAKEQYVLDGFSEELGSRVYRFEHIAADRSRTAFTVAIDLAMSRRYGMKLQDLPLLCRAVLERVHEDEARRAYRYTEADMSKFAKEAAERVDALRKKFKPRPFGAREKPQANQAC